MMDCPIAKLRHEKGHRKSEAVFKIIHPLVSALFQHDARQITCKMPYAESDKAEYRIHCSIPVERGEKRAITCDSFKSSAEQLSLRSMRHHTYQCETTREKVVQRVPDGYHKRLTQGHYLD